MGLATMVSIAGYFLTEQIHVTCGLRNACEKDAKRMCVLKSSGFSKYLCAEGFFLSNIPIASLLPAGFFLVYWCTSQLSSISVLIILKGEIHTIKLSFFSQYPLWIHSEKACNGWTLNMYWSHEKHAMKWKSSLKWCTFIHIQREFYYNNEPRQRLSIYENSEGRGVLANMIIKEQRSCYQKDI